jgi:hypothetical protein
MAYRRKIVSSFFRVQVHAPDVLRLDLFMLSMRNLGLSLEGEQKDAM